MSAYFQRTPEGDALIQQTLSLRFNDRPDIDETFWGETFLNAMVDAEEAWVDDGEAPLTFALDDVMRVLMAARNNERALRNLVIVIAHRQRPQACPNVGMSIEDAYAEAVGALGGTVDTVNGAMQLTSFVPFRFDRDPNNYGREADEWAARQRSS